MDFESPGHDWKKVKELFHEALRRDPAERGAYLNESCGDDLDLRIEVESLLLSLEDAKTFLEQPAVLLPSNREVAWQFGSGELVSHYRIVEPIGVGGMGQVYLAEDQNLYRPVALKVLPPELHEEVDRLRRFKREALAVSALNHPNILTIFEFVDVDGMPIIASEYVKGCTLRERLSKGPLDVKVATDIAVQVASALQTAHEAGVIHRDIKPENIMIRDDGYVKVLDFGLAKLTGDLRSKETDRPHTQAFSMPGVIMGTATYMSPEQARSMSIDARTDIFSLGIVLYEMVTGRVPFAGETTTDVIAEIIQKEPAKARSLNPEVSEELDRIISDCLRKSCTDRYQTISDLLADLRASSEPSVTRESVSNPTTESTPTQEPSASPSGHAVADDANGIAQAKENLVPKILAGVALIVLAVAAAYWYFNG